jgi:hypothetical protein
MNKYFTINNLNIFIIKMHEIHIKKIFIFETLTFFKIQDFYKNISVFILLIRIQTYWYKIRKNYWSCE